MALRVKVRDLLWDHSCEIECDSETTIGQVADTAVAEFFKPQDLKDKNAVTLVHERRLLPRDAKLSELNVGAGQEFQLIFDLRS